MSLLRTLGSRIGLVGLPAVAGLMLSAASLPAQGPRSVTVPVTLDHNRMLIQAEVQRRDGSWRTALLWIDTGNPNMMLSEAFARDRGRRAPSDWR